MTEQRIDHVAEALKTMNQTLNYSQTDEDAGAVVSIMAAQVHAQLAVAEQLRIANLIAYMSLAYQNTGNRLSEAHGNWVEKEMGL